MSILSLWRYNQGNANEQGCDIEVVEGGPGDIGAWMPSESVEISSLGIFLTLTQHLERNWVPLKILH